jgi:hypothetical protein
VKTFHDAEARVIGHTKLAPAPGAVNKMKVGTLRCEMANGTQFSVGTGFVFIGASVVVVVRA